MEKRKRRVGTDWIGALFSWLWKILMVCAVAFLCVWFFGRRASNIGDSMSPALANGDTLLVNAVIYHVKNPARGDVIVFKPKGSQKLNSSTKRVIGLPGETVEIRDGMIYIDGNELEERYETTAVREAGIAEQKITLGEQEYFVLGDNRLSSTDSRSGEVGNVRKSEIEGKAWFVIAPAKHAGFVK